MRDGTGESAPPSIFIPQVRLLGGVNDAMLNAFVEQLAAVPDGDDAIAIELMTLGGDADTSRRIATEIRLARERLQRRLVFIGKTTVYSAGVTIMGAFPREDRFLTRDTVLLLHCRQLQLTVPLAGTLRANAQHLREILEQIEMGLRVEQEDFAALVENTDLSIDELLERAATNWYLPAREALQRKLVAGLV